MPEQWTQNDFTIFGRYCDSHTIRRTVDTIRIASRAAASILMVTQGDRFFQSLFFVMDEDRLRQPLLQDALVSSDFKTSGAADDNTAIIALASHDSEGRLADIVAAYEKTTRFTELLRFFPHDAHSRVLAYSLPKPTTNVPTSIAIHPAHVAILSISSTSTSRLSPMDDALREQMYHLAGMVNASAVVTQQRSRNFRAHCSHLTFIQDVERKIDEEWLAAWSSTDFSTLVTRLQSQLDSHYNGLLQSAMALTASNLGNLYFASPSRDSLRLVAHSGSHTAPERLSLTTERLTVVTHVFDRRLPLIINDIQEFQRMNPAIKYLPLADPTCGEPTCELAVPILQRQFGSGTYSILGVLNVERIGSPGSEYTSCDLDLLKDVAARISLLQERIWHLLSYSPLARALTELPQHISEPIPVIRPNTETTKRDTTSKRDIPLLPSDLTGAIPAITQALESAFKLTRSNSATVRLLSPDRSRLVRVCTFPQDSSLNGPDTIELKAPSVNSSVAQLGRLIYLPDVTRPGSKYFKVRSHTRSELCLPLKINGRVIGTMNLESEYIDSYRDTRWLILSLSNLISLSFWRNQTFDQEEVVRLSSQLVLNLHTLSKCERRAKALKDFLATFIRSSRDRIDSKELLQAIEKASFIAAAMGRLSDVHSKHIDSGGPTSDQTRASSQSAPQCTIGSIVDAAIQELLKDSGAEAYGLGRFNRIPSAYWSVPISSEVSYVTRLALSEILYNSHQHTSEGSYIGVGKSVHGGVDCVEVCVASKPVAKIQPEVADVLYRRPFYDAQKMHLGCYLAGAMLRSVGGDVFLTVNRPKECLTNIEIPLKHVV